MATNFYLESRTDKKNEAAIRVSVTICGVRLVTSTGLKIAPTKWNAEKQRVKQGATNAKGQQYNAINAQLARIADHFATYEGGAIEGAAPTSTEIKQELSNVLGRAKLNQQPQGLTLWQVFDKFVCEVGQSNQWAVATCQKFAALKKHLQNWNSGLTFEHLTEKGLNEFLAYLRDDKEMKNTTIVKQLGFVKWFLRWATAKGYNDNTAFQTYAPKLKTTGKKVIFLEWDELMKIYAYHIPANGTAVKLTDTNGKEYAKIVHEASAIAKTRDIFCFCCFTSLRYSDAVNLKRANIVGDIMTLTTIKTADTITIELNKYARAILERYNDRHDPAGHVFPHITNQRMNLYLKELCELCGINTPVTQTYYRGSERIDETAPKYELIGTHAGRRTFVCNALMLGIPAEIVMKWTGHSDYKSMKPYIAIADTARAKAMNLFNQL